MSDLTANDIEVGGVYGPKRRGSADRQVIWRSAVSVQYDSDSVRLGQGYPTVSMEKFLSWAGERRPAIGPTSDGGASTLEQEG